MTGASIADRVWRLFGRRRVPDRRARDAGRLMIDGDLDGALIAAKGLRTDPDDAVRHDAYAVLAWVHLVRGERKEAEAAASLIRDPRTPDRLLTVALVVAAGGPSAGAAIALAESKGVLSMVGGTRVFIDHGMLDDVRAEIVGLGPEQEKAALENLRVGLVAADRQADMVAVANRLAELGRGPRRDVVFASNLAVIGLTELATRYLELAAERGLTDLERVTNDPYLADVRAQPAFAAVRDRILANAGSAGAGTEP